MTRVARVVMVGEFSLFWLQGVPVRGGPIQEVTFRAQIWASLLRRAGLRYRKPHTPLIEQGERLTYIQQQLGHRSAAFILKVYGHLLPRGSHRAVDALDDTTGRNPGATNREESVSFSNFSR